MMQCAVMHAYIDGERFQGYSIDAALRLLLGNFRLPGGNACNSLETQAVLSHSINMDWNVLQCGPMAIAAALYTEKQSSSMCICGSRRHAMWLGAISYSSLADTACCSGWTQLIMWSLLRAGEAQKIDRIMEKFAERYCCDNPGAFRSADGAYLLAFALIMLNTDAHNPQADKKLGLNDFINMCQVQVGRVALNPWLRHPYLLVEVIGACVEDMAMLPREGMDVRLGNRSNF